MLCIRTSPLQVALAAALVASLLGAPSAHAQSNSALAEQLFLDGQKLMQAAKYPEACAKFADSQRLDPAMGTLMHLADCNEKAGKLATAWSEFMDVAALAQKANQADREKFAREHAAILAGKLQKFVIDLPHPPDGVAIKLDSVTLPAGARRRHQRCRRTGRRRSRRGAPTRGRGIDGFGLHQAPRRVLGRRCGDRLGRRGDWRRGHGARSQQ